MPIQVTSRRLSLCQSQSKIFLYLKLWPPLVIGYGKVDRTVVYNTRGLGFKSHHWPIFVDIFYFYDVGNVKIKGKGISRDRLV